MHHMPFTGNPLDRSSNERRDDGWLKEQIDSPLARYLPMRHLNAPVIADTVTHLLWLDRPQAQPLCELTSPVLLGLLDGAPHFALDISLLEEPGVVESLAGVTFTEARSLAGALSASEGGILAQARSLLDWHNRHRFCSSCGSNTEPRRGGSMRGCTACASEHFPRTDPVVIMVVYKEGRCLLGKRSARSGNVYSTLAGFIEQGESIEEAVRREVKEEAGIDVDEITYFASQPWPFPSSLMIGCFAHTEAEDVTIDPQEIVDARWFDRDQIRRAIETPSDSPDLIIPGPLAIAHHLIKAWYHSPPGE